MAETLAGRGDRVKSYTIAVDVFGRGADFDSASDSIVRTEATRLRGALAKYYAGYGADDPIRILFPPGSYVPQFERRAAPKSAPIDAFEAPGASQPLPIEAAPIPVPAAVSISTPRLIPVAAPARGRVLAMAAFALLALALVAAFATQAFHRWSSGKSALVVPTVVVATTQSIGDDPKMPTVAAGLMQSLALALSRYNGLAVARATERQPADVIVAREQGKAGTLYVLEFSVDSEAARLRFRWRLIDAADQTVLWSDQVDEAVSGSSNLDVEDQIADGVARVVGVRGGILTLTEQHKQTKHATAGYSCVLRALSYTASLSVTLHAQVRDCLEQTVAQDPDYAEALALLSYVYVDEDRNGFNPQGSKTEILARALEASDRAVKLAPTSSLVQQMRSTVFFQLGDFPSFEAAARKAIELNPGNPARRILFGNRLFILGRYDEGAALVRDGLALEPFPSAVEHGFSLLDSYRTGNYRAAADEAATLDIDPDFYFLPVIIAATYGELGDQSAAALSVAKVLKLRPDYAETFRADWRNRRFQEDFIDKVADGLRKAGLPVK